MTNHQTSATKVSLRPDTSDVSLIWAPDLGHPAGGTVADSSSTSLDGTTQGTSHASRGLYTISDDVMYFGGGACGVVTTNTPILRYPPATMSAWFRGDSSGVGANGFILTRNASETYLAVLTSGSVRGGWTGNFATSSVGVDPRDDRWHWLCCIVESDGSTILYLDGQEVATAGAAASAGSANVPLRVGSYNGGASNSFLGEIGGVEVYSEAKTAAWVLRKWNRVANSVVHFHGDRDSWPTAITTYNNSVSPNVIPIRNGIWLEVGDRVRAGAYDLIGTADSTQIHWYSISAVVGLYERVPTGNMLVGLPYGEVEFSAINNNDNISLSAYNPDGWSFTINSDGSLTLSNTQKALTYFSTPSSYIDTSVVHRYRISVRHICVSPEGAEFAVYVDGQLVDPTGGAGTNPVTDSTGAVGMDGSLYWSASANEAYIVISDDSGIHDLIYRPLCRI